MILNDERTKFNIFITYSLTMCYGMFLQICYNTIDVKTAGLVVRIG